MSEEENDGEIMVKTPLTIKMFDQVFPGAEQ